MKKTKAYLLAWAIVVPIYGAISYVPLLPRHPGQKQRDKRLYHNGNYRTRSLPGSGNATRSKPLWRFLKTRTRPDAFYMSRPYCAFEPSKLYERAVQTVRKSRPNHAVWTAFSHQESVSRITP